MKDMSTLLALTHWKDFVLLPKKGPQIKVSTPLNLAKKRNRTFDATEQASCRREHKTTHALRSKSICALPKIFSERY